MLSHVLNAGVGVFTLLVLYATSMGVAAGSVLGDVPAQLRGLVEAGVVQLPGIMVLGRAVVVLTAVLPRCAATVPWAVLVVSILVGPLLGGATLSALAAGAGDHDGHASGALVGTLRAIDRDLLLTAHDLELLLEHAAREMRSVDPAASA